MNTIDLYHFLLISNIKYEIEKTVRLWSMRYVLEGPLYELLLEQSHTINPSFDEKAEQVPFTVKFYWTLKVNISKRGSSFRLKKTGINRPLFV